MIFYFTATGNSLYAARRLQEQLGGELYSIPALMREKRYDFALQPGEHMGFVFPVFFWGIPDILSRFTQRLSVTGAVPERTFILATMGGTAGSACEAMEKALAARKINVGYKFTVIMPDNYIPIYTMPSPQKVQRQLNEADCSLQAAAQWIQKGKTGDYNKRKGPVPSLISPVVQLAFPRGTKKFYADSACTGCGLCRKICPVEAIAMKEGAPQWVKARCENCMACLQRCPAGAIQYGRDQRKKGRYVNPRVTFEE